jgi:hypothetical protein
MKDYLDATGHPVAPYSELFAELRFVFNKYDVEPPVKLLFDSDGLLSLGIIGRPQKDMWSIYGFTIGHIDE